MTVPLRFDQLDSANQTRIRGNLAKMQAQNAPDTDVESYLRDVEHLAPAGASAPTPTAPPASNIHAEYASGNLAKRMQRENTNDAEATAAETPSYATQALGGIASLARDIPGAEALQAGARSLLRGQPYAEARNNIRGAEDAAPAPVRIGNRLIGGTVAAMALPIKSPTLQGAAYGGLSGALQSDPNAGVGTRARDAAIGAGVGAATSALASRAGTAIRAIRAPNAAGNVIARDAARDAQAATDYATARSEGLGRTNTPEIQNELAQPENAPVVNELLKLRKFQGKQPTDPDVLDALYKTHSDEAARLGRNLDAPTPNKPNTGRFAQANIRDTQGDLLDAMSGGTSLPGPMPTYRKAVTNYATASGNTDAVRYGEDMTRSALGHTITSGKNLDRTTVPAFAQWAEGAAPGELAGAQEGVLGATRPTGSKVVPGVMLNPKQLRPFAGHQARAQAGAVQNLVSTLEQHLGTPVPVDVLRALAASQGHPSP